MKILIVEDNAPFALALQAVLQRLSPKAQIVETLDAAFTALTPPPKIDTVVLDLTLPDAGPHQTLAAIQKMKEFGARVLVMTGSTAPELKDEIAESGASACFCKTDPDFVAALREEISHGTPEFTPFPVT
jgi:DNA-binding NarL/FixJ family response regulator